MLFLGTIAFSLAAGNVAFHAYRPNVEFPAVGEEKVVELPAFASPVAFNEAIVSWNVTPAAGAQVQVEARPGGSDRWYRMADWQLDDASLRTSLKAEKDAAAEVDTDTLVLKKPNREVQVRLRLRRIVDGPTPQLRLVTVSVCDTKSEKPSSAAKSPAWGKVIDVPQRAQGNYPRGSVLCSPTSLSMVLWHYANLLQRPELNNDVPVVEACVWDKEYDGAGNWPFNAAYAGSFPGITGYVSRFTGIGDLERWIEAGIPVICSVSLDILLEKDPPRPSGHLVVLVGFDAKGDPVFNDPARRDSVRRTYRRANFEKAWLRSHRTVYLVYPEGANVPSGGEGRWIEP
jgi:hypothetical protein